MKYASLALNGLLALAVIFLLVQHFQGKKPDSGNVGTELTTGGDAPSIVFVNADSLINKYSFFKSRQEQLEKREKEIDADLKARARNLEKEFQQAQTRVQSGTLTPKQIQEEEAKLMQKQQSLMAEQERLTQELLAETEKVQKELEDKVKTVLAVIRSDKGYDYILSYGPGTGVLMVNDSLDITTQVLEILNKQ